MTGSGSRKPWPPTSTEGRPAYHPKDLLKPFVYGQQPACQQADTKCIIVIVGFQEPCFWGTASYIINLRVSCNYMNRFNFRSILCLVLVFAIMSSCSNLNNEEIAKVDHSFSGCFGSERNRITLYKRAGATFAKLETNGEVVQDIVLSWKQINAFNSFVEELRNLREENGCTSVEQYVLYTPYRTIRRTDGGCGWNGFGTLERAVFGRVEE